MSEDNSVLGKRLREKARAQEDGGHDRPSSPPIDEDSGDDVGPMPMPQNGGQVSKKKRKGNVDVQPHNSHIQLQNTIHSVAPRTSVPGPPPQCRPVLQELHAPRDDQFLCGDTVGVSPCAT